MICLKNKTYYTLTNKSEYINYFIYRFMFLIIIFFFYVSYSFWPLNQNSYFYDLNYCFI